MRKRLKVLLVSSLMLLLILGGGFLVYASDYYKADEAALAVLAMTSAVEVSEDVILLLPDGASDTALVFYPGAKVEYTAYLPILEKLRLKGIASVLMKMPFNMAIFNANAADKAFDMLFGVENWFIGGHSMGGAMASRYAAGHRDRVKGLILLGAYIYGDVSPKDALTVYGTLNAGLAKHIGYSENVVIIKGGNHAQFGNYGEQRGDPPGEISREAQQEMAAEAVTRFILERTGHRP